MGASATPLHDSTDRCLNYFFQELGVNPTTSSSKSEMATSSSKHVLLMENLLERGQTYLTTPGQRVTRCMYISKRLAVCGPVDPTDPLADHFLEKKEDLPFQCFAVHKHGDKTIEICSNSRMDAHTEVIREVKQLPW
jgi:hypothetical protein